MSRSLGMIGRIAVALLLCGGVATSTAAAANLQTPRGTFETFLSAMNEVRDGDTERYADAVACLDLTGLPSLVRSTSHKKAGELKEFLDKDGVVDLAAIPDEVDGDLWSYRVTAAGVVELARQEDGRWLFSARTVASLDALVASVAEQDFDPALGDRAGAPRTLADWIRGRLPASLSGHLFILEIWQWIGLFAIALLIVDRLVRLLLGGWLRRLLRRSEKAHATKVVSEFAKPIGILAMALVWSFLLPSLDLTTASLAILMLAARLVAAIAGVWAAYKLVDVLSARFEELASRTETQVDDILVPMVRRALKIVVVAFGVLFVADNLDVDVTGLLAGLGIGGLAFALAAKDTVENLFGSVTVLVDRPFTIGDWVKIGDQEGTVEEIGFRSTRIRTFYNSRITVPNSTLVSSAVDNLGERRYRRFSTHIGVQYDTPPDRIDAFCEGIRELIRSHPYTRKDYYMVYLNKFGPSSLDILLYVFHDTPDWQTELRERHRLLIDIMRLAARLGVEFAFPTQTLHLASVPDGMAGVAVDPVSPNSIEPGAALGLETAQRIVADLERGVTQPPADFKKPDTIRTDR